MWGCRAALSVTSPLPAVRGPSTREGRRQGVRDGVCGGLPSRAELRRARGPLNHRRAWRRAAHTRRHVPGPRPPVSAEFCPPGRCRLRLEAAERKGPRGAGALQAIGPVNQCRPDFLGGKSRQTLRRFGSPVNKRARRSLALWRPTGPLPEAPSPGWAARQPAASPASAESRVAGSVPHGPPAKGAPECGTGLRSSAPARTHSMLWQGLI